MSRSAQKAFDPDIIKALMVVIDSTQAELTEGAQRIMLDELSGYPKDMVLKALRKCLIELRPRQFYIGAVLDRLDLGHPQVEVAWSMACKASDEAEAVLWTDLIAHAYGQVRGLAAGGDTVAARMAFKEAYGAALEDAQLSRRLPVWEVTPGTDRNRTNEVLSLAVQRGHISRTQYDILALPTPSSDIAALALRDESERQALLTHSPTITRQDGTPATVADVLAGMKVAQAEGEKKRSASHQAALEQANRLKVQYANKVKRYAKARGIAL
jgi:hypothetical protein